jgi:hypothetical protein
VNSTDLFNIDLFISDFDQTIIDKFQGNDFINFNMRFLTEDLMSSDIATLPNFCLEKVNLFDLSNFLVNTLCGSVLERNH